MSDQRDNSGTLGKNERREKETHPTHTGKCVIDGREYYISAWVKEGRNGRFFSLAFKPKEQRGGVSPTPAVRNTPPPAPADEFNDDIPF